MISIGQIRYRIAIINMIIPRSFGIKTQSPQHNLHTSDNTPEKPDGTQSKEDHLILIHKLKQRTNTHGPFIHRPEKQPTAEHQHHHQKNLQNHIIIIPLHTAICNPYTRQLTPNPRLTMLNTLKYRNESTPAKVLQTPIRINPITVISL